MSTFEMLVRQNLSESLFTFRGDFDESGESVTAMLAAMTEGLQANGFDVETTITVTTKLQLGADGLCV